MNGWIAIGIFGALSAATVSFIAWRSSAGSAIRLPLLVGYALRCGTAIGMYLTVGLFHPDSHHYDRVALKVLASWAAGDGTPPLADGKEAFPILLAAIYLVFGALPVLGIIVNVTASTLFIPVVASTTRALGGDPRNAAWLAAVFPPFLLWGASLLRESITYLLLATGVWALVRLWSRLADTVAWLSLAGSVLLLLGFRGSIALAFVAAALVTLAIAQRRRWVAVSTLGVAAAVVLAGVIANFDRVEAYRARIATIARTGFLTSTDSADPLHTLWSMASVVPRVLFGPFPWEWSRLGLAFGIDAAIWLVLLALTWRGWRTLRDRAQALPMLLASSAVLLALVATSGNYGTMQRLRVQAAAILIPLAAEGLKTRWRQPKTTTGTTPEPAPNVAPGAK